MLTELHADRRSKMTSKPVACLVSELGLAKAHSRSHVCDDSAFSERQFKGSMSCATTT